MTHEKPCCGEACSCDGEDTWNDSSVCYLGDDECDTCTPMPDDEPHDDEGDEAGGPSSTSYASPIFLGYRLLAGFALLSSLLLVLPALALLAFTGEVVLGLWVPPGALAVVGCCFFWAGRRRTA